MAIATKHLFALNTKVLSVILLKTSGVIHLTFSHGSHQVRKLFQTYALMLYFFFFLVVVPLLSPWCQWVIGRIYWSSALAVTGFAFPNCFIPLLAQDSVYPWPRAQSAAQHQQQAPRWQQPVWHQKRQHQEPQQEQGTLFVLSLRHKANMLSAFVCEGGTSGLINSVSISLHGNSYLKKEKRMKAIF